MACPAIILIDGAIAALSQRETVIIKHMATTAVIMPHTAITVKSIQIPGIRIISRLVFRRNFTSLLKNK